MTNFAYTYKNGISRFMTAPTDAKTRTILTAATEIFLSHGFRRATTDMIQKEARVSKATIYTRYPTKEALFAAVIEDACARFVNQFESLVPSEGDIHHRLSAMGRSFLQLALSPLSLALFRSVVCEAQQFPQLASLFYQTGPKVVIPSLAQQLEIASDRGEIDVHTIGLHNAATVFISLLRGNSHMECVTHPATPPSEVMIDNWVNLAVETFLRAYGTQPQ